MKMMYLYRYFIYSALVFIVPGIILLVPGVRQYIIETYDLAAIYNTSIIVVYLFGSTFALFSVFSSNRSTAILVNRNLTHDSAVKGVYKLFFAKAMQGNIDNISVRSIVTLQEIVLKLKSQRIALIVSCGNISPLIGLLGTFGGLSITIGSVGALLNSSTTALSGASDTSSTADTLQALIALVSSLATPLQGMNTAFVSSIYGVTGAILLIIQSVFVRDAFSHMQTQLQRIKLIYEQKDKKEYRPVRLESETLSDLKEMFSQYLQLSKSDSITYREHLAKMDSGLSGLNNLLGRIVEGQRLGADSVKAMATQNQEAFAMLQGAASSCEVHLKSGADYLAEIKQAQAQGLEAHGVLLTQIKERGEHRHQQSVDILSDIASSQRASGEQNVRWLNQLADGQSAMITHIEQGQLQSVASIKTVAEQQNVFFAALQNSASGCEQQLKSGIGHLDEIKQAQTQGLEAHGVLLTQIKECGEHRHQQGIDILSDIASSQRASGEQNARWLNQLADGQSAMITHIEQGQLQSAASIKTVTEQQNVFFAALQNSASGCEQQLKSGIGHLAEIKQVQAQSLDAQAVLLREIKERGEHRHQQGIDILSDIASSQRASGEQNARWLHQLADGQSAMITHIEQGQRQGAESVMAIAQQQQAGFAALQETASGCEHQLKSGIGHLAEIKQTQALGLEAHSVLLMEIKESGEHRYLQGAGYLNDLLKSQRSSGEESARLLNQLVVVQSALIDNSHYLRTALNTHGEILAAQKELLANLLAEEKQVNQLISSLHQENQKSKKDINDRLQQIIQRGNELNENIISVNNEIEDIRNRKSGSLSGTVTTMWRQLFKKDSPDKDHNNGQ